jgi:putative pyruvate formate lyase activating enzyme
MVSIVEELRRRGHQPTIVYNSNGYDLPETIRSLEDIVDVWLPDFKYSDDNLALELSEAPYYSRHALAAIKAMMHQTGVTLQTDDRGVARRGIIIRHLVLPGHVENSIGVLKLISEDLSPNLHLSLMSQYYPTEKLLQISPPKLGGVRRQQSPGGGLSNDKTLNPEPFTLNSLKRPVTRAEYESVLEAFHSFGFTRGWLQEYESFNNYRPDFSKENPFE